MVAMFDSYIGEEFWWNYYFARNIFKKYLWIKKIGIVSLLSSLTSNVSSGEFLIKKYSHFYARGPKFILLKCHCKIFDLAATQLLSARMNFWNNVDNLSEENNVRRLVTKSRIHLFESCKQALGQTNVYGSTSPPNVLPHFGLSRENIIN